MGGHRVPAVVHFVSDGKPWKVLMFEYLNMDDPSQNQTISTHSMSEIGKQAEPHLLWRSAFFRATGDVPPSNKFLLKCAGAL